MGLFFEFIDYLSKRSFGMKSGKNKELTVVLQEVKKALSEQVPGAVPIAEPKPKRKATKVIFDKSTGSPFEVVFSERGFLLEGTRMSFEELETALSKEYNIVLKSGQGLTLDAVKMQKILKYKDIY